MKRTVRLIAVLLVALALSGALASSAVAQDAPSPGCVVIVLAPYVTWADVTGGAMPVTRSLAESSAIGNVNIRSSLRYSTGRSGASQSHIAITMSAGSPSAFDTQGAAPYEADQRLEAGTAAEAYLRAMGHDMGGNAIAYVGLPRILRANEKSSFQTVPGALGQAVKDAGGATAAVGNSDGGYRNGQIYRSRPAALLAMDRSGLVTYGDVSMRLLAQKADAPYGLATDTELVKGAYSQVLKQLADHGGPAVVVLDPGDPERAFNFASDASTATAEAQRLAAASAIDRTVALARELLPVDATLIVVSTGQLTPESGPSGFGPMIVSGPAYGAGLLYSPSTHRAGLITDFDVSATALAALGIARPVEMLGGPVQSRAVSSSFDERVRGLVKMNAMATAVDTVRPVFQTTYITVAVIVLLACALLLRPMQRKLDGWGTWAARAFSATMRLLLVAPLATTAMYLVVRQPGSASSVTLLFVGTLAALWAVVYVVDRRFGPAVALGLTGLFTAVFLLADQAAGGPLSFSGMLSYSPLLGARYYGIGNEGASIVVGGALAGFGAFVDAFRDRRWIAAVRRWGPIVLGAAVVVVCAAPFMGANVGVIAWGTLAFGVLWLHLNGYRLTWKTVLAIVGIGALFVVGFSVYDMLSGAQTHLGRALASAGQGGLSELWVIVARKAETNWRVLRATNWSILLIAMLAFLGYLRWRPQGAFAETLERYPAFAVAMTAALWAGFVGYFTEDSGIVIPALVMLFLTGTLLHLMLAPLRAERGEPGP